MKAKIYVTLKEGILDPQGKAVQQSLETLGYHGLQGVRMGKYLEIEMSDRSMEAAQRDLKEMCEKLLANPVIEEYRFEIVKS
ncbi:MAG TPA: phosphoribosylformylglycinamidine synthase subunit PurS [Nitrospiria bacterium]|nr:phosphoribosylformylglycinamidine synthase subunit PurS [Nitrospiria bacterium]